MTGRTRAAIGLAGLLLGLTACTSAVVGSASATGGGTSAGASGGATSPAPPSSGGARTASCRWTADASGNPHLVDARRPPGTVPATGTATLVMRTGQGTLRLTLDQAGAPCASAALVALAGQGFFDGTPCHRETDSAGLQVLQCGDPTGTGAGGPTWVYPTHVTGRETYPRGTVAMANSGSGTDGSQFFLVWGDSRLPPNYTVVGTVDQSGLTVLDTIAAIGNDGANGAGDGAPKQPVTIASMTVG
jgi:peptidyl-prolyl cis-trans isomerase B (cyclophilin B)